MPIHWSFGNFRQVQRFPDKSEIILDENPSYTEILSRIPRYESQPRMSVSRDFILMRLQLTESMLTTSNEMAMGLNDKNNNYLQNAIKNLDRYLKELKSIGLIEEEADTASPQSF